MTVVKETIQAEIDALMQDLLNVDPENVPTKFSERLAEIIRNAILSATITRPSGIPVQTTPTTGTGTTTSPITATIQ